MTIFAPVNGTPEIFTGTANTELHAYNPAWTEHPSSNCTAICTGTGYGESSCLTNLAIYYYNVTSSIADYQVQADIKCVSIPNGTLPYMGGPALRVSSSAYTMYYARWNLNGAAGRWELVRTVNGQDTIIGTYGETISAGTSYTVLISAIGATIALSVNGMQVISVTDAGIASAGYPGMFWRANEISEATNWQAISLSNLQRAPDAASISDGAAVAVSVLGADLATGTDVATAGQPASESDAAAGDDLQASILADIQAPDSAQGSDSVSVTTAIAVPDSAACADAGATGDAAPAVSDSAQATEAVSVSAGIEAGDLAAGSDPVTFHTPPAVSQARDSSRINPVYLVQVTLNGGGPTLYFSDRNINVTGQIYEDYLKDLSGIGNQILRATSTGRNTDLTLTFKNDRFQAYPYLIQIGDTFPFEAATCRIYEVYMDANGSPSQPVLLFKGVLDQPAEIDLFVFKCKVSMMPFFMDKRWKQTLVTLTNYPNAYEDTGKYLPIVYGQGVLLPAVRTDWGGKDNAGFRCNGGPGHA